MEIETDIGGSIGGQISVVDSVIAELAGRQHRVVARWQLLRRGVTRHAIRHQARRGWLRAVHRGVYVVGPGPLSREGRFMAAVLLAGPGAVLSHVPAAELHGIWRSSPDGIHVTTPRELRRRPGIRFHRRRLPADELTVIDGIPVTTVPRTIFDLAGVRPRRVVESVMHEADVRRLADALSLPDLVDRYPGRRGVATIKAILAARAIGATITRSELEDRFAAFCDERELPLPAMNVPIDLPDGSWVEVDCVWPGPRVIVELDGQATHATPRKFERDRARDRALSVAGWIPVRVTWRQLHLEPDQLHADLSTLLARAATPDGRRDPRPGR